MQRYQGACLLLILLVCSLGLTQGRTTIPSFRVYVTNGNTVSAVTTNMPAVATDQNTRGMPGFIAYCYNPTLKATAPCNFTSALSTGETLYTATGQPLAIDVSTVLATVTLQSNAAFTIGAGGPGQRKVFTWCQTGAFKVTPPSNMRGFVSPGLVTGKCSTQAFSYHPSLSAWLATDAGVLNQ